MSRQFQYNAPAIMKRFLLTAGIPLLLSPAAPAQEPAAGTAMNEAGEEAATGAPQNSEADAVNAYRDLLQTTNELWFLLSGIRDKADADMAAARFADLVKRANVLDENLVQMSDTIHERESLDQLRYQIMDAYCSVDSEFGGLCRLRCYGSQELVDAFQSAIAGGMFDAAELPLLEEREPFTREESAQELARIRRLVEPDKAVLACLESVTNADTAAQSAHKLPPIIEQLRALIPDSSLSNRRFAESDADAVREAAAPVENLLWRIRSEVVRIAALPGYDAENFDNFSDSLDLVYETLAETHPLWFDDVFDDSFRIDLDEAFHESNPTVSNEAGAND